MDSINQFTSIIGHDAQKSELIRLIGRSGTYLFYGPPSIGKRTVAFELSRYFLCNDKKSDGCTCGSCGYFKKDHPDFMCVGQNTGILVCDIDNIIDFAVRSPFLSENKVVVIDNVHRITIEAANRLLKVLEESSCLFFLISSEIDKIIPTVVGRCMKIRFNSLNRDDISNILWKKMGFEPTQAKILGWIGYGVSADIFSNAGLYLKYRDMACDFISLMFTKDMIGILDFIDRIERKDLIIFVDMVQLILTDMQFVEYDSLRIVNSDKRDFIQKMYKSTSMKVLIPAIHFISQVKQYVKLNINLNLAFKDAVIRVHPLLNQ